MIKEFSQDFGPFENRIWLNCAHQGALPGAAVEAAKKAISWKTAPYYLTDESFFEVPRRLKRALGQLFGVNHHEIILSNSTSYGIHLLANGIQWKAGDEILLVEGDFPANILPWLYLEKKGVTIRFIKSSGSVLKEDDLLENITPATRLFCTSWVNSFTGYAIDIHSIGEICRENNVIFVLNGSQAFGARTIDMFDAKIDAFTCCGFKWLCGPYGTGFFWLRPDLLETLEYNQAYWLTMQEGKELNSMREYTIPDDLGASAYDVFCTANFFNFMPWTESVEYLLRCGLSNIETYDNMLVARVISGLDLSKYELLSPQEGPECSTLVILTFNDTGRNKEIFELLKQEGIDISLRENNLRVSPHLYNTIEDIDNLLTILHSI